MSVVELYVQVEVGFPDSKLVDRARTVLGLSTDVSIAKLVRLWLATMRLGIGGKIGDRSDQWIEESVGWQGEAGAFAKFIRENHLTHGVIKDWPEKYGGLEHKRKADRDRKRAERNAGMPASVRGQSGGSPTDSPATGAGPLIPSTISHLSSVELEGKERANGESLIPLDPAEFAVFGKFAGDVMGLVRSSRRPGAVLAVIKGELAGDYGPPVDPETVALACKDYAASSPERFSGEYFRGFVGKVERTRQKKRGRAAHRAEDQHAEHAQQAEGEMRRAEQEVARLVREFREGNPLEFQRIAEAAEKRCPVQGMFRDAMVKAEVAAAVRDYVRQQERVT